MPTFLALPVAALLLIPRPEPTDDPAARLTPAQPALIETPLLVEPPGPWQRVFAVQTPIDFPTTSASLFAADPVTPDQTAAPKPVAFEYSHGYKVRLKIHKYASFATLPLFATQLVLGESLSVGETGGKKDAHAVVGTAIGVLFGVNTVTGVWNMWEARKDPTEHTRRMVHGLLMLASDVGFLATSMTAPGIEHGVQQSKSTHQALAITSIGVASAGYLTMLFGR